MIVPLDTWGSLRDLMTAGVRLRDGTPIVVVDHSDETEDLVGVGRCHYDPARRCWFAALDGDHAYVPAHDRTAAPSPRCLVCRADLGPHAMGPTGRLPGCPACGLPLDAAIAPP